MVVNGWLLLQYPLFEVQLRTLTERVEQLAVKDPKGFRNHPAAKLLATINRYIKEIVPKDPNSADFRQGDTLGPDNRHWFRAKFHARYRLFFRFSSQKKAIVYVWVNDESSLRKAGSKRDPYAVFRSMLNAGEPPASFDGLLKRARQLE